MKNFKIKHLSGIARLALVLFLTCVLSFPVWSGPGDPPANPSEPPAQTPGDENQTPAGLRVIDATFNGLWFGPARNGEGFGLAISETTAGPTIVVSYYTYDNQKQNIFFIGANALPSGSRTVTIPVDITSGANFGDAFKPADVVRTPAGTLTFSFTSCTKGTVDYDLNNLGSGQLSVERLIGVEGLDCS
ncbi:MAG: hypothetical protein K0U68_02370 [Gammaproteobacteria bacterium]|nr:hypothetical protein [Gammaproteobacteria bacterium]